MVKTQGRHGEVASEIFSEVPERFVIGMQFLALSPEADAKRRELKVEDLWPHKGLLVLKFSGVDSISEAERLIGCELQVPREQRSELQPGWNYVSDLVGCKVFDGNLEIGRVEEVQFGAGEAPLLIVRDGECEAARRSVCGSVSRPNRPREETGSHEAAGRAVRRECSAHG